MDYELKDLTQVVRSWGRGVVFRAPVWDVGTPLEMTHLADTEGDLIVTMNAETGALTLTELTGPAAHEMDYAGENPTIEMPLYLTDPDTQGLVSPNGSRHAGNERRGIVAEHTLAIFPENLWIPPGGTRVDRTKLLSFAGGVWTFDAAPLSAAKEALLDQAFWLWRCGFSRPPRSYKGGIGDERKNLETVTVQSMFHPDLPDGHHIFTVGNPFDFGINLEGMS